MNALDDPLYRELLSIRPKPATTSDGPTACFYAYDTGPDAITPDDILEPGTPEALRALVAAVCPLHVVEAVA